MKEYISRRALIKKILKTSLGLLSLPIISELLLSSCERKNQGDLEKALSLNTNEACLTNQELSQEQQAIRKNLKYVDQTPISTRTCDNCKFYTNATPDSACAGCKLFSGPVHPKGYCTSWYPRM
jgi:hypothetical protein